MGVPGVSQDRTQGRGVADERSFLLPAGPEGPAVARGAVRRALAEWGLAELSDDAALAVSELAANAYVHGSGPVELHLALERGPGAKYALVCAVSDTGLAIPRAAGGISQSAESGRGLLIVAALVRSFGVRAGEMNAESVIDAPWRYVPCATAPADLSRDKESACVMDVIVSLVHEGFGIGDGPDTEVLDWQDRALCAQTDPEAFFPEKGGSTREAKKVCRSCEVRDECLEYALDHDERFGIWGGLSERERRRLKRQAV
jgi:WhiB family redox-sensing transcriptional regulator